jgi:hypothetical protein
MYGKRIELHHIQVIGDRNEGPDKWGTVYSNEYSPLAIKNKYKN